MNPSENTNNIIECHSFVDDISAVKTQCQVSQNDRPDAKNPTSSDFVAKFGTSVPNCRKNFPEWKVVALDSGDAPGIPESDICDEKYKSFYLIRWGTSDKEQEPKEKTRVTTKDNSVTCEFDSEPILMKGEKIELYNVEYIEIIFSNLDTLNIGNIYDIIESVSFTHDSKKWLHITPRILRVCCEMGIDDYSFIKDNEFIKLRINLKSLYKIWFPMWHSIKIVVNKNPIFTNMNVEFDVKIIPKKLINMYETYKEGDKFIESICRSLVEIPLATSDEDIQKLNIRHKIMEDYLCEYAILIVECGKCKSTCTCEQKIKNVQLSNSQCIAEWSGEDMCTTYPYMYRQTFPKCATMSNNIYVLPLGGNKCMDGSKQTSAMSLARLEGWFDINMSYMHPNDKLYMLIGSSNVLRSTIMLGGITCDKAYYINE